MRYLLQFVRGLAAVLPLLFVTAAYAAPAAIETKYADVNGIRMHYAKAGSGELVLFLHGFPEYWYQWKTQLEDLGQDHLAVAPDMRGYHLSTAPKELSAYRIRTLVEDVRALADHLGRKKFVLVGQDWGGIVAWVFAMYYPDRLSKLVILNAPHPAIFERELRDNPAQQLASQYMLMIQTPEAEKIVAENNYAMLVHHVLGEGQKAGYVSEVDKANYLALWNDGKTITGGFAYYRASRVGPPAKPGDPWVVRNHLATDLPTLQIKVPTLVLWGMQDAYLLAGNLSGLGNYVPDMKVKLFPDGSHWLNRSKSAEVNAAIREFIQSSAKQ